MNHSPVVWDVPTRLIHWTIALCIVLNWFFLEEGDPPHTWFGYAAVAAVSLRILWGIYTPTASHFRHFPLRASQLISFLRNFSKPELTNYPAHNPAASWTYIAIWTLIVALAISGWMMGLDAFWGEEWLENTHANISDVLKLAVLAHFAGMIADSIKFRRKTFLAMLTGRRS
jgi:cytochrome b